MEGESHFSATPGRTLRAIRRLTGNEVHLWIVEVGPESDDRARRHAATSAAERDRAARFRAAGDRERFLSSHGALRLVLAEYLDCEPHDVVFASRPGGKPYISGARLEFNMSHSGALALIAVAHGRQVGVDVESIRPLPGLAAIAARVCTPDERATLAALPESSREGAFLAMWTRKEALAKMTGEGLGAVLRDPCLSSPARCRVVELQDVPGYAACVAAEGTGWHVVRSA